MGIAPLVVLAIYLYAKRIRTESTTIQERESDVLAVAQEGLSSIRMVHAFGREEYEVAQFHTRARHSLEANMRFTGTQMRSSLIIGSLMALGTAAMYYLGALHVLNGTLSLGQLTQLAAYVVMLYQPLEALTYTTWALEGAAAGAQRCFEVLDQQDDVRDLPERRREAGDPGGARLPRTSISGTTRPRLILEGIDLEIGSGQTVAFVGGTGAGKTTLLSLVPRFYDPTRGAVLLDGEDLRAITKKSLRQQISIVLQDTLLFSTTIRENIAYGRPDASEEEIVEAAKRAQAHDFIMRMPEGYAAQVGERGGHLSVGQRQRLGHRARLLEKRAHPAAGRADQRAGPHHGGGHHGDDQGTDARPHHADHHPPHRHRARHGKNRGPAARARRRRSGPGRSWWRGTGLTPGCITRQTWESRLSLWIRIRLRCGQPWRARFFSPSYP